MYMYALVSLYSAYYCYTDNSLLLIRYTDKVSSYYCVIVLQWRACHCVVPRVCVVHIDLPAITHCTVSLHHYCRCIQMLICNSSTSANCCRTLQRGACMILIHNSYFAQCLTMFFVFIFYLNKDYTARTCCLVIASV